MQSPETDIQQYTARKIQGPLTIDGDLNKPAWQEAAKSHRFVDMVTGDPGMYDTRSAVLWDDTNLYIAFWVEEPFVSATQSERDSIVFLENDLEVFIDGGDCYYELEINALNTIYEVFFIWRDAYQKGGGSTFPSLMYTSPKHSPLGVITTGRGLRSGGAGTRVASGGRF